MPSWGRGRSRRDYERIVVQPEHGARIFRAGRVLGRLSDEVGVTP